MKKDYDYYVNRKNTPHLDLCTKLIGMFYFWNGMNFILGSAYALSIGQKKLAYPINKQLRGNYYVFNVEASTDAVKEFDRKARIDENILRHIIIREEEE